MNVKQIKDLQTSKLMEETKRAILELKYGYMDYSKYLEVEEYVDELLLELGRRSPLLLLPFKISLCEW